MKSILFSVIFIFLYQIVYSQVDMEKEPVKDAVINKKESIEDKKQKVEGKKQLENDNHLLMDNLKNEKDSLFFSKDLLEGIHEDEEYIENDFRKFEITFFLSTPIFAIYNLILNQFIIAVSFIKDHNEHNDVFDFTDLQWGYILSTSILSGLVIGLDKYFEYKTKKQKKLTIHDIQTEKKEVISLKPKLNVSIFNIRF